MWRYILKRLVWTVAIMFMVTFVIFTITYFTPGDPARLKLGVNATESDVLAMRIWMGLDKPYLAQLLTYVKSILHGDFGTAWSTGVNVAEELLKRLPITVMVGGLAMVIQVGIGIPMGVLAATHQGKWQDYLTISLSMLLISMPNFWVALMAVVVFSVRLRLLPVMGIGTWKHFVLPIGAIAIGGIAGNARQTRSAMLEVFRADFVTTARAKGMKERRVIWRHMFPNAMMPIITMVISGLSRIVGGSAIIESVFSIPGVGLYLLNGISNRDYPIIRGCTILLSLFSALSVLLMDLIYAFVDPRIKAIYVAGSKKRRG